MPFSEMGINGFEVENWEFNFGCIKFKMAVGYLNGILRRQLDI